MLAAFEDLPCGFISFLDDGSVSYANQTLCDLIGRPRSEIEGARFELLLNVASKIFFQTHLMPLLKMSGKIEEAHISLAGSNAEVPALLTAVRRERNGQFVSDAILVPIYRRIQFEEELIAARKMAQAANEEKDRANAELQLLKENLEQHVLERTEDLRTANAQMEGFNYSIAHDFRAPLRAISSSAQVLLQEASANLSEEHVELLQRQTVNAVRLGKLIDDLLAYSRLARVDFSREEVDVTALARSEWGDLRADGRCNDCNLEVAEGLSAQAGKNLLRLVLQELLGNACKFSPKGGAIRLWSELFHGETVFHLKDEGIGFDSRFGEKLFLPFERLVTEAEFPGNGIGLANVQRVIARHKGRIWASGSPGIGSEFCFTLG